MFEFGTSHPSGVKLYVSYSGHGQSKHRATANQLQFSIGLHDLEGRGRGGRGGNRDLDLNSRLIALIRGVRKVTCQVWT